MKSECAVNVYYNQELDYDSLKELLFHDPTLDFKNKDVEDIYKDIIDKLSLETLFHFTMDSNNEDDYKASIEDMIESIKLIINDYDELLFNKDLKNRLIDKIDKNFRADAGISSDEIKSIENPADLELVIGNQSTTDGDKLKLDVVLSKLYGSSFEALNLRDLEFTADIFKACIFNSSTEDAHSINTVEDLNVSIGRYKASLYQYIIAYLKDYLGENFTYSSEMYKGMEVVTDFDTVLDHFYTIVSSIENISDILDAQWYKLISQQDLNADVKLLLAVNAYVNLKYFDVLLKDKLGQTIALSNKRFKNIELSIDDNKYVFGKAQEHKVKHWGTDELKDALTNIAKFSKLVLSTIKIYSFDTKLYLNKYATIQTFANAITHLVNVVQKSSEDTKLKRYIRNFHANPKYYAPLLFKELFENGRDKFVGKTFTILDFNLLTSVYDLVYKSQEDTQNGITSNPSINTIETKEALLNFKINGYSIVDAINGVIDRTMETNYLQTIFKEGRYLTTIKKKAYTRKDLYTLANKVNILNSSLTLEERTNLLKKYNFQRLHNSWTGYTFKIGEHLVSVSAPDGVLSNKALKIKFNDAQTLKHFNNIFDILKQSFSTAFVEKIIRGKGLNANELLFRDTLEFIDTFLHLNLLSENGISTLLVFAALNSNKNNFIDSILQSAVKAAAVLEIYNSFDAEKESNTGYNKQSSIKTYVSSKFSHKYKEAEKKQFLKSVLTNRNGVYTLNSLSATASWIDDLITAEAIYTGEISSSTTKDLDGKKMGNYRTSFLGGNIFYYLEKYNLSTNTTATQRLASEEQTESEQKEVPKTAAQELLFTKRPDLIRDILIDTDVLNMVGTNKRVRRLNVGELLYTHIIHNFYGTYISDSSLRGTFIIQPTTYSDKVTPINYAIAGNRTITKEGAIYDGKTLATMSSDELIAYYEDTIVQADKAAFEETLSKYKIIFDNKNLSFDEISTLLKTTNFVELATLLGIKTYPKMSNQAALGKIALEKGIRLILDHDYRVNKDGSLKLNELLYHYANILTGETLKRRFKEEEINFLNDILKSGISFYTKYANSDKTTLIEELLSSDFFKNAFGERDAYISKWVKNGKLVLAKINGEDYTSLKIIPSNTEGVQINPLLEKFFYIDTLLSNNLRFTLTGTECAHPDKAGINITNELKAVGIEEAPLELLEENGKLTNDIIKLANSSNELIRKAYANIIRKIEAVSQGTQLKRNVIIPATLQYTQYGPLNGLPKKLKVAVIQDTKALTWNMRGEKSKIDAHDGSAWQCPLVTILENKSLQDLEVGIDKKPIWHHFDEATMSATLLKFATFCMNNERMSNLGSDISLYNLFKRMTDLRWKVNGEWQFPVKGDQVARGKLLNFNLLTTVGYKKNLYSKINFFEDILQSKPLYYVDGDGTHRIILDFGYDEELDTYYTEEAVVQQTGTTGANPKSVTYYHRFDDSSKHYKYTKELLTPEILNSTTTINSLFLLYNTLGGLYSESLQDDMLVRSDASLYATVAFMNNVTIRTSDSKSNDLSQYSYYQPLKEMMIAYAVNSSAVKNGAANVNDAEAWKGDIDLSYMELDIDGLGIQMDADHDIEDAELTEFSLVISALEAGGRLHDVAKDVYEALGLIALKSSAIEIDAVDKFLATAVQIPEDATPEAKKEILSSAKSLMYDVLGRITIENYQPNNEKIDLAKPIIQAISQVFNVYDHHKLDHFKIAFSDSNLYATIISSFMSNLNKKSIKRKYPGSGCVMVPGYHIVQLYKLPVGNDLVPHQFDDVLKAAKILNRKTKFFENYDSTKMDVIDYNLKLVNAYLETLLLEELEKNPLLTLQNFMPTDIVNVYVNDDGNYKLVGTLNFNDVDDYYQAICIPNYVLKKFGLSLESSVVFVLNLTKPRDLAPVRMSWDSNGKHYNIFSTEEVSQSFGYSTYIQSTLNRTGYLNENTIATLLSNNSVRLSVKGSELKNSVTITINNGECVLSLSEGSNVDIVQNQLTNEDYDILAEAINAFIPEWSTITTDNSLLVSLVHKVSELGKDYRAIETFDGSPLYYKANIILDREAILKVFDDLDAGIYKEEQISNFLNKPAELVMSNLYADKFGISPNQSLVDVVKYKSDLFKLFKLPNIEVLYDMCFTTRSNENVYFTFGNLTNKLTSIKPPKKLNWRTSLGDNGNVYFVNKQGERLFVVGLYVQRNDIDFRGGKFFSNNIEIKNTQNLKVGENDKVFEYHEFISRYEVVERINKKIQIHLVYKINIDQVLKAVREEEGTKEASKAATKKLASILSDIYSNGSFNGIRINEEIHKSAAINLYNILDRMNVSSSVKELIDQTRKYLKPALSNLIGDNRINSIFKLNSTVIDGKNYNQYLKNYYNSLAVSIYTSFLKSLNFTSSRIPALTLQSFMLMRVVGFSNNTKNICYVSHWQTYLLGSDYDIDKAYIMGLSFDDNGLYIGWSNLFDYSSPATLRASEQLPIPKEVNYELGQNTDIDISSYAQEIINSTSKELEIKTYARLLKYLLDKNPDENGNLAVYFDEYILEEDRIKILKDLNIHSHTKLNGEKTEKALKNFVSSKILHIIQNPRNMDLAYTSIDSLMDRIRSAAKQSPKGKEIYNMTLLNPATKLIMQVSNMVGKNVIGIAATGEKVFFNLSYYWNEGIRSGDIEWLNNLKFCQTFDRIEGRSKGKPTIKTRTRLANVNFEEHESLKAYFNDMFLKDSAIRAKYNITDDDIRRQTEKWKLYVKELKITESKEIEYVDLNISMLLSAATDNAKELILSQINATSNLAKCYLHLMMLGFRIEDIVSFMISPAVLLVGDLSDANMFDEYLRDVKIKEAIKLILGNINLHKYFPGVSVNTKLDFNDDQSSLYLLNSEKYTKLLITILSDDLSKAVANEILNYSIKEDYKPILANIRIMSEELFGKYQVPSLLQGKVTKEDLIIGQDTLGNLIVATSQTYSSKSNSIIQDFFKARLYGFIDKSLILYVESDGNKKDPDFLNGVLALSDLLERIITRIQESGQNVEDFYADLNEFKKVDELSDETSALGQNLLKANQGLPVDEAGLISFMLKIQRTFEDRSSKFVWTLKENQQEAVLYPLFKENNPFITNNEIHEALTLVNRFDLANFDVEKWMYSEEYRKATTKVYNIIKGTWNSFDIIEKSPNYKAIFDIFRKSVLLNNNLIRKSHLAWAIVKEVRRTSPYIDDLSISKLLAYADDLLVILYLKKFNFPVFKDQTYFKEGMLRTPAVNTELISLDTEAGRASFKLRFEKMIEDLKKGLYINLETDENTGEPTVNTISDISLASNAFIQNLIPDLTSLGVLFYKLNLDMQQVNSTLFNRRKYLDCVKGFIKLKNYKFNGRPLTDWFMLYNFVVNKNMWGSDRLTSLFGTFINLNVEDSLIVDYFKTSGLLDWDSNTFINEDLLKHYDFSLRDALFKMAPIKSESSELVAKEPIIKEYVDGVLVVKARGANGYYLIPIVHLLSNGINESPEDVKQRVSDYLNYSVIQTPFFSLKNSQVTILNASEDVDDIEWVLNNLIKRGLLEIYKINC